jgi:hypothetical protein
MVVSLKSFGQTDRLNFINRETILSWIAMPKFIAPPYFVMLSSRAF